MEAGPDVLLLNGKMLTGRDAAHKRIADMLAKGEKLPVDFTNRVIYYVGPVDPVRDEVVGPAGPTTATRMDKFTEHDAGTDRPDRHDRQVRARPGRDRGDPDNRAVYLMAVGGAAYLVSKAIRKRRSSASPTSAWRRSTSSTVKDMPVTVAVDANGTSVHHRAEAVAGEDRQDATQARACRHAAGGDQFATQAGILPPASAARSCSPAPPRSPTAARGCRARPPRPPRRSPRAWRHRPAP